MGLNTISQLKCHKKEAIGVVNRMATDRTNSEGHSCELGVTRRTLVMWELDEILGDL